MQSAPMTSVTTDSKKAAMLPKRRLLRTGGRQSEGLDR